tara:strand:+ start:213 stop:464 length:252 start_codon:yes stop_codon:yes gene_type:complete
METDGEVYLCNTDGENANGNNTCCEECGDRMHEDDSIYSEADEETLCEDCCTWCEDRDDHINTNNAIYNNYSGNYHHENDLDR